MTTKKFQIELIPKIQEKFPHQEVMNEWAAFTGLRYQYSPRVDIALGPFNTSPGSNLTDMYNILIRENRTHQFLRQAFNYHQENLNISLYDQIIHPDFEDLIYRNQNARCLFAFEIENKNSKKHILGSVVNAASLGRLGFGIAFNPSTLR